MPGYDADDLSPDERGRIVKCAVTPRPIAWVSTRSEDGHDNLAPFSSYNYVGSSTPVLMFTSSRRDDGTPKDSPRNAIETGEFAVNVVTTPLAEAMDATSASLPPEESEFDFADVERAECARIDAPRVADAPVTMECRLHDTIELYDRLVVMGDVVHFHVDDSVLTDGRIDMRTFVTVGRLGGPYYTAAERMELERRY
jgi:flavin reductase (DIM6/NTAB) family NADH-FMN oxidoreductase RutF